MRGWIFGALLLAGSGCATPGAVDAPTSTAMATQDLAVPDHARAHWLYKGVLAWDAPAGTTVELLTPQGAVTLLLSASLEPVVAAEYPHLAGVAAWSLSEPDRAQIHGWLKGPLALRALDENGAEVARTGIQIGEVLDALYANDEPLGARVREDKVALSLWAPTARRVSVHLFDPEPYVPSQVFPMREDEATGVWHLDGPRDWDRRHYVYEVEVYVPQTGRVERNLVTDPYSLNLSANGERTQIVNLDDPDLKPEGWDSLRRDLDGANVDRTVYELHVRDFSIGDASVDPAHRGRYLAFAQQGTTGMRHLAGLADAGLSDVHLLPTNDCASIPERAAERSEVGDLSALPANSEEQQARVKQASARDGFNWCYDPLHYLAPDGSYASDPDGVARIVEFRRMVKGLADHGLGTVLDVVFNHTPAHGQADNAVLDRIVPGYYQRRDDEGRVANSTCCSNTASERAMMERLLVEGLMVWARDYKVSGFRFDLMGHHSKDNLLKAQAALATLTLAEHGVDGADLLLYGEGWNFGEVANGARFVQASQANMKGTGIGTFNDRIRDAVRGGAYNHHGEEMVRSQGFASGLHVAPNALNADDPDTRAKALRVSDAIRASLAGSIGSFAFETADGSMLSAADLDYNGAPAGYALHPGDVVNYAAAHDNPTLFDSNAFKLPRDISPDERVRWQNMATSVVMLAQGMPFIHAGQEVLRSKSLDHNSYNSGDWFNRLDVTGTDNGWGRGLPPRPDNEKSWDVARALLVDDRLRVGPEHAARATSHLKELLAIRRASPLLRMETGDEVRAKLHFLATGAGQEPGLIVMGLGPRDAPEMIVVFNATRADRTVPIAASAYRLHPVQSSTDDAVLRKAAASDAGLSVPALTTAVFVRD